MSFAMPPKSSCEIEPHARSRVPFHRRFVSRSSQSPPADPPRPSASKYPRSASGQRGEQIAAALNVDTKTMRPAMHALIAESKVKTRGERRGMQYFAA